MKTINLGLLLLLFFINTQAQNQNVKSEVKTTITTIKDSEGEKTLVKKQDIQEVQNIELKDADSNILNKEMKETPVQVTSLTKVTNPDGTTRTVDIDRSSYYLSNNKKYKVNLDASGYKIISVDNGSSAILRKTSTNSYIYRAKGKTSIGYFDTEGNLILETYEDKSDRVTIQKYTIINQ